MSELSVKPKAHPVRVFVRKCSDGTKWQVRIKGITSGFVVHINDCDDAELVFELDASRFKPVASIE